MRVFLFLIPTLLATPMVAEAAPQTFADLVNLIIGIINPLFTLIIGGIVLMILFGLAKFVFSLGSSDNVDEGKQLMFWGVVALFVALSFWGLVEILRNTFLGPGL